VGFVGSRPFVVAVLLSALLLAAGVGAYAADRAAFGYGSERACDAPPGAAGHELAPSRLHDGVSGADATRVVAFDVAGLANATGASLVACSTVGDLALRPSPDGKAHVVFTLEGRDAGALDASDVHVALTPGDAPRLAAWVSQQGFSRGLFGLFGASTAIEIELPVMGPVDATLQSTTGDQVVERTLLGNLTVRATAGDVTLRDVDLAGNLSVGTTTGDVDASLASVAPGNLTLRATTGDLTLRVPARGDVGYDARGDATTGDVTIRLGDAELDERSDHGPSAHEHVRTSGFAARPTQVGIAASATTGDVTIALG
jgi:hypothetical protein